MNKLSTFLLLFLFSVSVSNAATLSIGTISPACPNSHQTVQINTSISSGILTLIATNGKFEDIFHGGIRREITSPENYSANGKQFTVIWDDTFNPGKIRAEIWRPFWGVKSAEKNVVLGPPIDNTTSVSGSSTFPNCISGSAIYELANKSIYIWKAEWSGSSKFVVDDPVTIHDYEASFSSNDQNYQGNQTVYATVTYSKDGTQNCGTRTFSKAVWLGKPKFSNPKVDGSTYYPGSCYGVCPGFHYAQLQIDGADLVYDVSWGLSPSGAVSWQWEPYSSQVVFETMPYYTQYPFSFTGTASNSTCGSSQFTYCFIYGPNCQFLYGPNPADKELTVSRYGYETEDLKTDLDEIDIILYNDLKEVVYLEEKNTMSTVKIPLKDLKNGDYYLHIIHKDGDFQEKILIRH